MASNRKQAEKDAKIQKFEAFVEQKLKPDLLHVMSERDKVMGQQRIFSDLSKNIKLLEQNRLKKLKTMVNLGSEVYAQAEVPDTSRIYVDIGLGFHVEFTWSEALQFISVKEEMLTRQVEEHTRQIANIKSQIKLVMPATEPVNLISVAPTLCALEIVDKPWLVYRGNVEKAICSRSYNFLFRLVKESKS